MLRAVIIDDEMPNCILIKRAIELNGQLEIIGQFTQTKGIMKKIYELMPDVIFIDIEMPGMSGLEIAEKVYEIKAGIYVVFVTAYSRYAIDAFKVNALDYILKPLDEKEINRVVLKIMERHERESANAQENTSDDRKNKARIFCLGEFDVYGENSCRKVKWITSKVEELFAYLIMHPGGIADKWKICDILWPDLDEEKSLTNLHTSVYRLKRTLQSENIPIHIKSSSFGYWAEPEYTMIDYYEFYNSLSVIKEKYRQHSEDKYEKMLIDAVNLGRGELFANKSYIWAAGLREDFEQSYINAVYMLTDYYNKYKKTYDEKLYLKKLLYQFPYEERAIFRIMDIYKAQKDKVSLVKQYNWHKKYLKEELNCEPSIELQKKFRNIVQYL